MSANSEGPEVNGAVKVTRLTVRPEGANYQ
jgi:hypothetical protein